MVNIELKCSIIKEIKIENPRGAGQTNPLKNFKSYPDLRGFSYYYRNFGFCFCNYVHSSAYNFKAHGVAHVW
jgi:hypothetical protein